MFKGDKDKAVKRGGKYETLILLRILLLYNVAIEYIWSVEEEEVNRERVKTAG